MRNVLKRRLTFLAGTTLLLAGCAAVGPDYKRPAIELPQHYGQQASPQAGMVIPEKWWTLFHDATLDQLIQQALTSSPDIANAVARIEEADANLRIAGSALLPEIDATGAASRSRISTVTATPLPASVAPIRNDFKVGLSSSFELDFWGHLRRQAEAARALALASRYGRSTVELSLTGMVADAYINLRSLDAQIRVTQAEMDDANAVLTVVERQVKGGTASALDLAQTRSNLYSLTGQLADLKRQRDLAQNLIGVLVGKPGLTVATGDIDTLPVPPIPPAGLPSSLLERRPDLMQAEEQLIAANAKIGVAKSALFPTISLTAGFGGESKDLSDVLSRAANVWNIGPSVLLPIFDGGRLSAQVDAVTAQQKEAVAAYRKAVQGAFSEVSNSLINSRQQTSIEDSARLRREQAREALRLAQVRYQAGYTGYLLVLDAQRTANDAELATIRARQARLIASVDLMKALGGGWKPSAQEKKIRAGQ